MSDKAKLQNFPVPTEYSHSEEPVPLLRWPTVPQLSRASIALWVRVTRGLPRRNCRWPALLP